MVEGCEARVYGLRWSGVVRGSRRSGGLKRVREREREREVEKGHTIQTDAVRRLRRW
jgi:hypothetical protein